MHISDLDNNVRDKNHRTETENGNEYKAGPLTGQAITNLVVYEISYLHI